MNRPAVRALVAVVVGVVVGGIVVTIVELAGMALFPVPAGIDVMDSSDLAANMGRIPVGAKASVVAAWALGVFVGSWVAAVLGRRWGSRWTMRLGMIVGVVMLVFIGANLLMIAHPIWMTVSGLVLPLPAAWLATVVVGKPGGDSPIDDV